jgi:thiol:disulfide interchange protein DsbA
MIRFACLILALALPLAACDADSAKDKPPAPVAEQSDSTTPAPATPNASETAQPAPPAETSDATIEQLAAVEEPAGDAAAAESPVQIAQAPAAAEPFQEGKEYVRLAAAQPTSSSPEQIEVAEAFMYSCPHCFDFEPHIAAWVSHKPANVNFVRLPVNFNPTAALHMRAYYALQTLGVLENVHKAIFDEIHLRKDPLADPDSLAKFLATKGVEEKALKDAMASFAIDTRTRKTETLLRLYQVGSVPTLIINGKYRTDVSMTGGYDRLFEVVDFLIKKEEKAGAGEAPAT